MVLSVLTLLAAGGGALYVRWTVHRPLPTTAGRLDVPGLHHTVEVGRDRYGIPHIYADNPHDLFLAQGYVEAQDRFWQMDTQRNIATGRLSEMFGPSQVENDKVVRTLGWSRVARQEADRAAPRTKAHLRAFSEGVNAYLEQRDGPTLSVEYAILGLAMDSYRPRRWTPVDSVVWFKAVAWQLNSTVGDQTVRAALSAELPRADVDRLCPPYDFDRWDAVTGPPSARPEEREREGERDRAAAVPAGASAAPAGLSDVNDRLSRVLGPSGTGIGSNSRVVSGSRTASGAPLLANDPHWHRRCPASGTRSDCTAAWSARRARTTCPVSPSRAHRAC